MRPSEIYGTFTTGQLALAGERYGEVERILVSARDQLAAQVDSLGSLPKHAGRCAEMDRLLKIVRRLDVDRIFWGDRVYDLAQMTGARRR